MPENVENAIDHLPGLGVDAGGTGNRANLDAFATAGAGVNHGADAGMQGRFEGLRHGSGPVRTAPMRQRTPDSAPIEGPGKSR
jgi:hypothetical protein